MASGAVRPLQKKSGEFSRHLTADFFNTLSHFQTSVQGMSGARSPLPGLWYADFDWADGQIIGRQTAKKV
jgi:hypothetical protein